MARLYCHGATYAGLRHRFGRRTLPGGRLAPALGVGDFRYPGAQRRPAPGTLTVHSPQPTARWPTPLARRGEKFGDDMDPTAAHLIDVHAHFVTDEYLEAARRAGYIYPDGMPGWPSWDATTHLELNGPPPHRPFASIDLFSRRPLRRRRRRTRPRPAGKRVRGGHRSQTRGALRSLRRANRCPTSKAHWPRSNTLSTSWGPTAWSC